MLRVTTIIEKIKSNPYDHRTLLLKPIEKYCSRGKHYILPSKLKRKYMYGLRSRTDRQFCFDKIIIIMTEDLLNCYLVVYNITFCRLFDFLRICSRWRT